MADLSCSPKRRRLFIGGLHESVAEEDIFKRFNVYGSVLSVQKITRAPTGDFPGKTFAFMDIDISEREYQRCCSVYSKAKWKGGTISIQPARESFLTRRERECREATVGNGGKRNTASSSSLVKGSTDGGSCKMEPTGKWAKGAGGCMPPVVRLHGGGGKVKTYKTSRHSHQGKQLSGIGSADTSVDKLTWTLDYDGSAGEVDSISERSAGDNDSISDGSAGEDDSNSERSAGDDDSNSDGSAGDDDRISDGSAGEDETCSEQLKAVDKSCRTPLEARNLPNNLPAITCMPVVHACDDSNVAPILGTLVGQCQSHSTKETSRDTPAVSGHVEDSPLPLSTCRTLATHPNDSNLLPIMETLKSCSSSQTLNREFVDGNSVSSRASKKKKQSEQRRQKALEERAERKSQQHTAVGPQPKTRRIVFSSSDDEQSSEAGERSGEDGERSGEDDVEGTAVDKDSGIQGLGPSAPDHHIRMTLFDSSDSEGEKEGEENPADELIGVKPQFEGKTGARLFKLQQRFRRDKRFQLDERFLSDSDSDVGLQREASNPPEEEEGEEDTALSKQIQEEMVMQNSIIDQILGSQSVGACPPRSVMKKNLSEFQPKRYDPSAKDHEVMEFEGNNVASRDDSRSGSNVVEINDDSSSSSESEGDKMDAQSEELEEKYYSVQGDLKNTFHQTLGDTPSIVSDSFSFAALFDSTGAIDGLTPSAADHEGDGEAVREIARKPKVSWLNSTADSSSGEECGDGVDSAMYVSEPASKPEVSGLFFFHTLNDRLSNRLGSVKGEGVFMRHEPLEELERGWPQLRAMYKQSYKQRRRDALRWLKKRKDPRSLRN